MISVMGLSGSELVCEELVASFVVLLDLCQGASSTSSGIVVFAALCDVLEEIWGNNEAKVAGHDCFWP